MAEYEVKGELFIKTLELAGFKPGGSCAMAGNRTQDDFTWEKWYPYEDFCGLLADIKSAIGKGNPMIIYQLGFSIMKRDRHWQDTFGHMDPAEVFTSTRRQETQYRVGSYSAAALGKKHILVTMDCKECRPEWCEFYRGRLQGVLELTGRTGVVHLQPADGPNAARVYDIKWG